MLKCKIFDLKDKISSCSYFTPWSFIHFLSGTILKLILNYYFSESKNNIYIGLFIHTIYEAKDLILTYIFKNKNENTFGNSIGDTISFIFGFYFGKVINNNIKNIFIYSKIYILSLLLFTYLKLG